MKSVLSAGLLTAALLSSCSLLQRKSPEPAPEQEEIEAPFAPEGKAATPVMDLNPSYESEISRMATKLAALETKVEVLTANLEKAQMRHTQPVIEAGAPPAGPSALSAPVEETDLAPTKAPSTSLPVAVKASEAPSTATEKEFRDAMDLFQTGQNLEASSRFALFAKKNPRHLLASHALYWAGEAGARGQQWALAIQNWQELQNNYPRSAYLPEALAGLARAYEKQGDFGKAKAFKATLLRSFPKSPVAVALNSDQGHEVKPGKAEFHDEEEAPAFPAGEEGSEAPAAAEHE